MGMFGNIGSGLKSLVTPENLMLLGATMKDIGAGGSDNFMGAQQMIAARQAKAAEQQWAQGLLASLGGQGVGETLSTLPAAGSAALAGPGAGQAGNPGEVGGAVGSEPRQPPSLRELMPLLTTGALRGYKGVGDLVTIIDKTGPDMDFVNGVAVDRRAAKAGQRVGVNLSNNNGFLDDMQDPANAGKFRPKLEDGQQPLYDGQGNVVAVRNLDGSVQAAAERAGAVKGAEARATAPYDFITTPTPTGAPQVRSKSTAAGGIYTGQSPSEATVAKAGVEGELGLPQALQTADDTLKLIDQIRNHPGREYGTGMAGVLPGIPGTSQKDFVTLVDQAKGKAFLEAFASLKGGGQITEVEGRKATEAIARLDRTQTKEGFLQALDDLEDIVEAGKSRATRRAARAQPATGGTPPSRAAVEAELRRRGLIQ